MATVADLYEAIKKRECILFLGAGVHYPPPADLPQYQYPVAYRPPLGNQLCRRLAADSLCRIRASLRKTPRDDPAYKNKEAELKQNHEYIRKYIRKNAA